VFGLRARPDLENFTQNQQSAVMAFAPILTARCRKSWKARDMNFGSLVVDCEWYCYLSKYLLCSIYFADRWRCKCACRTLARKNAQVGKFEHPSLPHLKSHGRQKYYFARIARALEERWDLVSLGYLVAEKLRVKLWKKIENRKIGKVWGPISRLRDMICKKQTTKRF